MMNKVSNLAEAIAKVKDGDLIAANFWGPGSPSYLCRAISEHNVKDLTICVNNFVPRADVLVEKGTPDPASFLAQTKKIITAFASTMQDDASVNAEIARRLEEGSLEFESMSHGIMMDRLYAGAMGLGGIYSPIGVDTVIDEGKEKRVIDGIEYIFEKPLRPDVGLIKAEKADTFGNLVYCGTSRASNPVMAMASRYTIAEVFEIVEPGELDPETIVTPGVFVDKIVLVPEDDLFSKNRRVGYIMAGIEYRLQKEAAKLEELEALRRGES